MFQILDFILFGIMFVSGLLALARGFTRELSSLVAWGAAAAAAYFAVKQKPLLDLVAPHVDPTKPAIAQIIVAAAAFIVVLILVSIISVRISDRVVDSSAGAFDRSLGFVFGLVRGLVLVGICYLFYGWIIPTDKQEDWVRNAMSMPAIRWVATTITNYLPPDIQETLTNSSLIGNAVNPQPKVDAPATDGVSKSQQQGLDNLSKDAAGKPIIGQDTNQ
jgi:membrane protein required for colicin V production